MHRPSRPTTVHARLRTLRRLLLLAATAAAPGRALAQGAPPVSNLRCAPPRDPALPTVFHIGDSTVRNGRGDGANGEWGWGDLTPAYFDTTRVNVVNCALGGRSSRTYFSEGLWAGVLRMLKAGDVVLMQFGHNDGSAINDTSRARGSIRGIGDDSVEIDNLLTHRHEVVHSYGWYLRRFIADTRAKGATPVVASPIPRNMWRDGAVVRDTAAYAGWAAQVARAEGVPFIDLNGLIAREYEALGPTHVAAFFPHDHTHTNLVGARLNARVVIGALKGLEKDPVGAWLSPAAAPVEALRP